jgi:hypothetical protein
VLPLSAVVSLASTSSLPLIRHAVNARNAIAKNTANTTEPSTVRIQIPDLAQPPPPPLVPANSPASDDDEDDVGEAAAEWMPRQKFTELAAFILPDRSTAGNVDRPTGPRRSSGAPPPAWKRWFVQPILAGAAVRSSRALCLANCPTAPRLDRTAFNERIACRGANHRQQPFGGEQRLAGLFGFSFRYSTRWSPNKHSAGPSWPCRRTAPAAAAAASRAAAEAVRVEPSAAE